MKKFLYISLFIIITVAAAVLVYFNEQTVVLNLGVKQYTLNLPLVFVAIFIAGIIIGYLISIPSKLRLKSKLSKANKQLNQLDTPIR